MNWSWLTFWRKPMSKLSEAEATYLARTVLAQFRPEALRDHPGLVQSALTSVGLAPKIVGDQVDVGFGPVCIVVQEPRRTYVRVMCPGCRRVVAVSALSPKRHTCQPDGPCPHCGSQGACLLGCEYVPITNKLPGSPGWLG